MPIDQPINEDGQSVGLFFDALIDDYTATIERCFPRYWEMLWGVLDYVPSDRRFDSILELGCGTGNLSALVNQDFPAARLRIVDLSEESLAVCRSRFKSDERIVYQKDDFRNLRYELSSFDFIVSSISIHHLTPSEKRSLFANVYGWLKPDGIFAFADQCAGATDDLYARHIENWKEQSFQAGSTDDQWNMWMQHQADHDHHDTLIDQIDWLREAGFSVVDCPWRYLLWSVIQARKTP